MANAEAVVEKMCKESSINYVFVRPPQLGDATITRDYIVKENEMPDGTGLVARSDVADFTLLAALDEKLNNKIMGMNRATGYKDIKVNMFKTLMSVTPTSFLVKLGVIAVSAVAGIAALVVKRNTVWKCAVDVYEKIANKLKK